MKYSVTMTKSEIKSLCDSFNALSKTVLNAILPQIDEDYAEMFDMSNSFDSFMDKLETSGGMGNKDFTIEYIARKDDITVNVEMDTKLILKVLSFYKKFLADILPYIVAFCKKHEDELDDLTALLSSRAEAMGEALMEMIEDFDLDALQNSAWGCFKDMMNPVEEKEDVDADAIMDEISDKIIAGLDTADDPEEYMHHVGDIVVSSLTNVDLDDAVEITTEIFKRVINHYDNVTMKSIEQDKEAELEKKYHNKNTEE